MKTRDELRGALIIYLGMTFYQWLMKQVDRDDIIGDFAHDAKYDPNFPAMKNLTLDQLQHYLWNKGAAESALIGARQAMDEYRYSFGPV